MFSATMPFCGTKYTLLRDAFNVGKISSKSSSLGSDGRTRIIRGILVRIFLRRSGVEERVICSSIKRKPPCLPLYSDACASHQPAGCAAMYRLPKSHRHFGAHSAVAAFITHWKSRTRWMRHARRTHGQEIAAQTVGDLVGIDAGVLFLRRAMGHSL
jgi:hypothetical protein